MNPLHRTKDFASETAALIVEAAKASIAARNRFRLGLAGGNTPKRVYAELAKADLPWEKVWITFGDERCVPPEDDQSNFKMARLSLLESAKIPNVLRMRGELEPTEAALKYEAELNALAHADGDPRYVHDLLLLGMGDDGHTASLFPDTAALAESERNVVSNFVPKLGVHRITLTFPAINASRQIFFLVEDAKKAPIVQEILAGGSPHPAERVHPVSGNLKWIVGF